jgi:HAD superfamily hydrolase (TIGR01509 family)
VKRKKRVILFDFDGTVIDTMNQYADIASEIISKYTHLTREEAREKYLETSGRSFDKQLEIMGIDNSVSQKIYREFIEAKRRLLKNMKIPENVVNFIEKLKKEGLATAVSTNNECPLVQMIEGINVFDIILCYDGKTHEKGEPHLRTLLQKEATSLDNIIFIGDSPYDIRTYSALGVKCFRTRGLYNQREQERIYRIIMEEING